MYSSYVMCYCLFVSLHLFVFLLHLRELAARRIGGNTFVLNLTALYSNLSKCA